MTILVFGGSTRKDSANRKLADEAALFAEEKGGNVKRLYIRDYPLPLYDGDLEAGEGQPKNATFIRNMMIESTTIIISTPEYNSSVPGVLKNLIDWVSRTPEGKPGLEPFKGKKFILLSASPGKLGGSRSLNELKRILTNVGGEVAPESFSLPGAYDAFNEDSSLKDKAPLHKVLSASL